MKRLKKFELVQYTSIVIIIIAILFTFSDIKNPPGTIVATFQMLGCILFAISYIGIKAITRAGRAKRARISQSFRDTVFKEPVSMN